LPAERQSGINRVHVIAWAEPAIKPDATIATPAGPASIEIAAMGTAAHRYLLAPARRSEITFPTEFRVAKWKTSPPDSASFRIDCNLRSVLVTTKTSKDSQPKPSLCIPEAA